MATQLRAFFWRREKCCVLGQLRGHQRQWSSVVEVPKSPLMASLHLDHNTHVACPLGVLVCWPDGEFRTTSFEKILRDPLGLHFSMSGFAGSPGHSLGLQILLARRGIYVGVWQVSNRLRRPPCLPSIRPHSSGTQVVR